jgi:hypothetical protein
MASVTLPTTIILTDGRVPRFIQANSAITIGRALVKASNGKADHATNSDVLRANVFGVALSGAGAAGQWIAYAEPGDRITGSGLTKGVTYYLDHGTDEVQTLTITGTPAGGSFTITYAGQTTAAIAFNASAANVVSALELLSGIGSGGVTATGGALPGTPVVITFKKSLGAKDVALMTTTDSLTGGTAPASAIVETTPGAAAGNLAPFADLVTNNAIVSLGLAESTTIFRFDPIVSGVLV